ncbi:GDSL-like Lipase/Acylhydrolase [Xylariaceae sp. FL0804]|nr:GDSL-like Lipase/Acylhydrolase [Xylariaceae sp. FL0804]
MLEYSAKARLYTSTMNPALRLFYLAALLAPATAHPASSGSGSGSGIDSGGATKGHCAHKPPAFFLAGDSTTATQSASGGGWGDGFLSFLVPRDGGPSAAPAPWGVNFGHDGATTVSFVSGGDWANVTDHVRGSAGRGFDVWVTIQFGHNDEKPEANISLAEYQRNLQNLAEDVRKAGGTPLLVTPLTRRVFTSPHVAADSLHDQRLATINAARATRKRTAHYLDLNRASLAYVDAIGDRAAQAYDLGGDDTTHLDDYGSVVFGRMVADLLIRREGCLERWIRPNRTLSYDLWHGIPA